MKGACLCGAVTFATDGPLRDPGACHCGHDREVVGGGWNAAGAAENGEYHGRAGGPVVAVSGGGCGGP